jgi:hypothetical protein
MPGKIAYAMVSIMLLAPIKLAKASSSYLSPLRQRYPVAAGTRLDGCSLCHTTTPSLGSYGQAFRNAGRSYAAVEGQDSDGDGHTNLAEIGALTFPGDKNDFPKTNLYFPVTVSTAARSTGFAITNSGSSAATVVLNVYQDSGERVPSSSSVSNYKILTMPAHTQVANVISELFGGGLQLSSGWVRLASGQASISGFFLNFDNRLTVLDGIIAAPSPLKTAMFLTIDGAELSLVNPNQTSLASVDFTLIDDSGRQISRTSAQIPANGRYAGRVDSLFSGAPGGYVAVSANPSVIGSEFFGSPSTDISALSAFDATAGAKELYAPQFAAGGGVWRSSLTLINLESAATTLSLSFVSDSGVQIGRTASIDLASNGRTVIPNPSVFGLPAVPESLVQGYVKISSSTSRIAGFVCFGDPSDSRFQTALPCVAAGASDLLFSQVAQDDTWFTGLAVINPNAATAEVRISVFRTDGTLAGSGTYSLVPNGRFSKLLGELVPDMPSLSKGYFTVQSTQPVFGFAVFGTQSLSVLSAIPSQ